MVRRNRRVLRPAPPGVDPNPKNSVLDEESEKERDEVWGDTKDSNDQNLLENRPPHWAQK